MGQTVLGAGSFPRGQSPPPHHFISLSGVQRVRPGSLVCVVAVLCESGLWFLCVGRAVLCVPGATACVGRRVASFPRGGEAQLEGTGRSPVIVLSIRSQTTGLTLPQRTACGPGLMEAVVSAFVTDARLLS